MHEENPAGNLAEKRRFWAIPGKRAGQAPRNLARAADVHVLCKKPETLGALSTYMSERSRKLRFHSQIFSKEAFTSEE